MLFPCAVGVDGYHVAYRYHCRGTRMIVDAQIIFHRQRQSFGIGVVQPHVKRAQPPQYRKTDAAGANDSDMHPLEIIRALGVIRDALGLSDARDEWT